MNTPKNKIKTPGYFVKRLRDNGFIVLKMFNDYGIHDPRRWTVLVDPGGSSVFITCFTNKEFNGEIMFELNDGGVLFNKNYNIQTDSIEVIIKYLIQRGISNKPEKSPYYAQKPKYIGEASKQA